MNVSFEFSLAVEKGRPGVVGLGFGPSQIKHADAGRLGDPASIPHAELPLTRVVLAQSRRVDPGHPGELVAAADPAPCGLDLPRSIPP